MCVPALGLALSIASSAVSFAAQQQDYENQSQQWRQNYVNALASGRDEQRQIDLRMRQEQDAFHQERHEANIEGAQLEAEAESSAASSGVGGLSLKNIMVGIRRDIDGKVQATKLNYENTVLQLSEELKNTNTKVQNQINSVQRPSSPSPAGAILKGIGGGLKGMG
ncbi:MAG: hypothetical protein JJ891_06850 [Rhizobiaceae bacterium]|nr:hypothetical protein [Rhizobiaceae bacterium]